MATDAVEKKRMDWLWLHVMVVCILMFGAGFLNPIGAITPVGMKVAGIFLGLLYGWTLCGMFWPSLLGLIALGFSGMGSVKEILVMSFGNETIIFLIFILVLVQMLVDSGVVSNIANFILTCKFLQGRPWVFSFAFLCVCGLLSTFGQAFAAFFLCWGLLDSIFAKMGYKPYEAYPSMMIIGVVVSAAAFGVMIPFKAMPFVILGTFSSITGIVVNYLQYMLVMVPVGFAMLAGYVLACRIFFKPDVSKIKNLDVQKLVAENNPVTKRQKAILLAFGLALVLLLLPGSLPRSWALVQMLNMVGNAGLMIICTILFILIKVDGEPILNFTVAARNGMNWGVLFMLAVVLLMSTLITNDATGIKIFLVQSLSPVLMGHSPVIFLLILFLLALILTNFMNNIVVGFMFLPILAAFSDSVGANPVVGVILILLAINTAFLTPAASPATAMLYAKPDWLETKTVFKFGLVIILVFTVVSLVIGTGLGYLVFGNI